MGQSGRTNSRQAGFTIVELMIVIMIIGVPGAIVLPTIRSNAVRARMSEAILALSTCKNAVTELYNSGGDPPGPGNWGCEASNVCTYVDTVDTNDVCFFSSRRRHTRFDCDWSSDVCSSD